MVTRKALYVCLLFCLAALAGCGEKGDFPLPGEGEREIVDKWNHCSYIFPEDWVGSDPLGRLSEANIKYGLRSPQNDSQGSWAYFGVFTAEIPTGEYTYEDWIDIFEGSRSSNGKYSSLQKEEIAIPAGDAVKLTYQSKSGLDSKLETTVFFRRDNRMYRLAITCFGDNPEQYMPVFERAVETFRPRKFFELSKYYFWIFLVIYVMFAAAFIARIIEEQRKKAEKADSEPSEDGQQPTD